MTLQEQFNAINRGTGNKEQFLKHARNLFPQYLTKHLDYNTSINVLKTKQIISEQTNVVTKGFDIYNWKNILAEEVKAEEKETSKEVKSKQDAYDATDVKNADNINGNEIWKGYYAEMKDPANADKTGDELKKIVVKNLSKDPLYYTKNGMFGVKGLGYTDEAPGLGKNTQPTSKNASILGGRDEVNSDSDVVKNSLIGLIKKNVKDTLSGSEAKISMPKKVKEMSVTPQNSKGVKKMDMPGKEKRIKLKEGLSLAELLAEENNQDSSYSDPELIQWAEDEGMEELIVLNPEGGLENRDELLSALTGIKNVGEKDYESDNDLYYGNTSESKLRSAISKLIKEELTAAEKEKYAKENPFDFKINGKKIEKYTQNGDSSYDVTYDDSTKDTIYSSDKRRSNRDLPFWDELNMLNTASK